LTGVGGGTIAALALLPTRLGDHQTGGLPAAALRARAPAQPARTTAGASTMQASRDGERLSTIAFTGLGAAARVWLPMRQWSRSLGLA
jgi:hypothetical protein